VAKEDEPIDKNPYILDIRHMAEYLFDVEVGARQGLRFAQEGFREAIDEFRANQATYGERAGISQRDFEMLITELERYDEIEKHMYQASKLAEKLEESHAIADDKLQRMVFGYAHIIEARARAFGDSELLAVYERVRAYRSAIGVKAAKTRRRNEAELENPQNPELPELPGELPPISETAR
jgi:hypothetical protein